MRFYRFLTDLPNPNCNEPEIRTGDYWPEWKVTSTFREVGVDALIKNNEAELVDDKKGKIEIKVSRATARPEITGILKNPLLLKKIDEQFERKIEKENKIRLTIFLCGCGTFVKNPSQAAAYNVMINSNSGAGKSYVTKRVIEIFPQHLWEYRTRISPTAFTYWHNSRSEPSWTWDGKICYLEDIENAILNHPVFKVMCSEGSKTTITINNLAVDIEIRGHPIIIVTIAEAKPKSESLRRFPIATLDESETQTEAIMKRQAKGATSGEKSEYSPEIIEALGSLKRVNVIVPYAERLVEKFPKSNLIARTHFGRFIDLIKASAALHQQQRTWNDDETIEASWLDYEVAKLCLLQTTENTQLIPLTKKQRQVLTACERQETAWFSVGDVSKGNAFLSESKWYEYMDTLAELGFFETDSQERSESRKPVRIFKLKDKVALTLPSLQDLGVEGIEGNDEVKGIAGIELVEWLNSLNSPKYRATQPTEPTLTEEVVSDG